MARLVLVSNRVPSPADRGARAGGLAAALSDAVIGGLWFGWSGEVNDATPAKPQIRRAHGVTYATLDLGKKDYEKYYVGFANSTLWPLLHFRMGLMDFDRSLYQAYFDVNRAFAAALRPLLKPDDVIWVHDYHLIPLGGMLRDLGVRNAIGFFLHVPFVPPSMFAVLPGGPELLRTFTAYDLVGVQTRRDLRNLLDCHAELLGLSADGDGRIAADGRNVRFAHYPIGIDTAAFAATATESARGTEAGRLRQSLTGRALIVGVDRLDYSKGLPNRFEAYGRLLARRPEYRSRVTYLQIAARSRDDVPQYRAIRRDLDRMSGAINGRYGTVDWTPLRYITRATPRATLAGYFRIARVGLVTPLRDGMNLVAKEFVAAQDPHDPGVLVLSAFAGAVHELDTALVVNPFDADATAEALDLALKMKLEERKARWQAMWSRVNTQDAAQWRRSFLSDLGA
ncbi:MAG: alpha,alpha-trehalose-phosphate synthase (UDP-forming) [Rhodospirillales bacterium]